MEILLPSGVRRRLEDSLREAGDHEIGGILMGEFLEEGRFRVREISVQRRGGSVATFIRSLTHAVRALARYFKAMGEEYTRYNYLGEWHSHPRFSVCPSGTDRATMREIVDDPQVGAHFAVLMIVRLGIGETLEASLTVFWPSAGESDARLVHE